MPIKGVFFDLGGTLFSYRHVSRQHGQLLGAAAERLALADPKVDAVIIASSTDTHAELAIRAARAGKAIFDRVQADLVGAADRPAADDAAAGGDPAAARRGATPRGAPTAPGSPAQRQLEAGSVGDRLQAAVGVNPHQPDRRAQLDQPR